MALDMELATPEPSRRTIVRSAAWALPAIALATSLPAAAASGPIAAGPFSVAGTCYSRTQKGVAYEFRIRWNFALGAAGLPAGTLVIIETKGGVYNHAYQVTGSALSTPTVTNSGGVRTSTYVLGSQVYSLDDMITGFYASAYVGGVVWSCSVTIVLPSGYVASSGSVAYAEVGETQQGQLQCA
ncbi:MAG: hypothetical protein NVV57_10060 [Demequina sp.]|nr:hypothetical protein [Demequina sp.]